MPVDGSVLLLLHQQVPIPDVCHYDICSSPIFAFILPVHSDRQSKASGTVIHSTVMAKSTSCIQPLN